MYASSQPSAALAAGPRPRRWSPRRVSALLAAVALIAASVALIGGGAFAAFAGSGGTYVDLGAHGGYSTDRYALTTDSTDWRATLLGWADSARLEVASENGKPIFVGVAAPDAIGSYLSGSGYTKIGERSGGGVVRADHAGAAPATPPGGAVDWTAHAQGAGTQTLRFDATDDRQVALVMNADGSRPVRVRVESSAVTLGGMPSWVPAGLLGLGVILMPAGIVVLRRTIRPRTRA